MRPPLHSRFVDKARSALTSAIEVYNKPAFEYREETFAILATNAWELLLKARLLQINNNRPRAIQVYRTTRTRRGTPSRRKVVVKNRSGTPMTLGLYECMAALEGRTPPELHPVVRKNIEALCEIRDGAVHYIHASNALSREVLGVAAASVRNFVQIAKQWFAIDLSKHISLMLPLAFLSGDEEVQAAVVSRDESKLIEYLAQMTTTDTQNDQPFSVAVNVQVKFQRSKLDTATPVRVTNDPDAVRVVLTDENIRERYPWDYTRLTQELTTKYADFRANQKYHGIRKELAKDAKFAKDRYLDPGNAKSPKKTYFNPNIVAEFDKHYTPATA